jgi:hypothetical protein
MKLDAAEQAILAQQLELLPLKLLATTTVERIRDLTPAHPLSKVITSLLWVKRLRAPLRR